MYSVIDLFKQRKNTMYYIYTAPNAISHRLNYTSIYALLNHVAHFANLFAY